MRAHESRQWLPFSFHLPSIPLIFALFQTALFTVQVTMIYWVISAKLAFSERRMRQSK